MKAIFTTPWVRASEEGYVPAPIDPYNVAVMTTHLEALYPGVTVLVHSTDQSHDVVVELVGVELDDATYRQMQDTVNALTEVQEVCVFIPVDGIAPPVAYQAEALSQISVNGAVIHTLLHTPVIGVFANLRGALDFTKESQTIHDAVVHALTEQYVGEQGVTTPWPVTPLVLRSHQDVSEAINVLKLHLWVYPDTVDWVYSPSTQTVQWTWLGRVDPYTGPSRRSDVGTPANLAGVPDGYAPIGLGDIDERVQRALGEAVRMVRWRDTVLVSSDRFAECSMIARSLK